MRVLGAAHGNVIGLAFSPDGRAVAAAVEDRGVYLWNLEADGRPVRLDSAATKRARTLHFSPDGRSVAWLSWSGLKVYDRDEKRATAAPRLPVPGDLFWLTRTPDGSRLVTQHSLPEPALVGWAADGDDWDVRWSVSTEQLLVESPTLSPDGERLAMLVRDTHGVRWWERPFQLKLAPAGTGRADRAGTYPYSYGCPLVFSPGGDRLVGVHGMTLLVWPVPELGDPWRIRNDSSKHFTAAAYHPSGRHLFVTSNDTTVHVFDAGSWARVARFTWDLGQLRSVVCSPDGSLAAAGDDRGQVVVWDVDF